MRQASKEHKITLNKSFANYQQRAADELRNISKKDTKALWKILNNLNDSKKKDNNDDISLKALYDHFKILNETVETENDFEQDLEFDTLPDDVELFLNCPVTEDEIKKVVSNLKNGKASGYLNTAFSSNSTDTEYVPLLNKVKTPVMAEIDLSKLGEQLKAFMQIETKKVITEKIVIESKNIHHKLESKINAAIENFKTAISAYTADVLHNTSIAMRVNIERNINKTFARRVHSSYNRHGVDEKIKGAGLSSYGKDHKGKLFYTMFPIQDTSHSFKVQFIITADTPTNVDIISEYAEINRTVIITTGVEYINIPSVVANLEAGRTYTTVLISADQLITVVGLISTYYCNSDCESSSFIVLPFTAIGTEYSLITQPNNKQNCGIIATATNTTVVIESSSEKEANKRYPYRSDYSDILFESLIPVDKWDRNFIIPPIYKALNFRIRIISRYRNTTVTIKDNSGWLVTEYGDQIEINLSPKSYFVSASNPILLCLYALNENQGISMMIVPGIEHFSKEYVIAPPKDPTYTSYITIMIKSSDVDGLRFVGNLLSVESTVIMARNESYTSVVKKMAGHSVYKIRHVSRNALYGVVVYGFRYKTSYGYPAGFRF
ncbi:unnamed protein product [Mytilus edulis]|uniref:IgGFc-binding protein N-terminal domain-containing protein n=1 Tax=Mytilus edulis TaxID=6550 RepID=A0A8S3UBQ1_MYTED|nr:unnamed protein product [Mytilus edulis]